MPDLTLTNLNQSFAEYQLDGIECELRGIHSFMGAEDAAAWWYKAFAHKYPDYRYDTEKERVVRRNDK